jgi:hypothetical protein
VTATPAARPARARRSTPAELSAAGVPDHEPTGPGLVDGDEDFNPETDFDLGKWRAQKGQQVEAVRDYVLFRLDDRRDDAPAPTYTVQIPLFSKWPFKALRMVQSGTLDGFYSGLAMMVADPDAMDVIDELENDEIEALVEYLAAASGVTPGESRPSGASSRSIRRR